MVEEFGETNRRELLELSSDKVGIRAAEFANCRIDKGSRVRHHHVISNALRLGHKVAKDIQISI